MNPCFGFNREVKTPARELLNVGGDGSGQVLGAKPDAPSVKSIIRCRETGLYYAPHVVGHWTDSQEHAFVFDTLNEALTEVQAPHFTTQCWHIVWPGWSPKAERRTFREWLRDAWTSFKHNLFQ